jgi:hypothetical protein
MPILATIPEPLNAAGWLVMTVSVGSVLALLSFCMYRVLTLPPVEIEEHLKGPLEIDTRDTQDAD